MVSEIKDIRLYKVLLETADTKINNIESIENELFTAERELNKLNKKHAGIHFCLSALLFTVLSFVALRMAFVLIPKDFPYYYLAPVPGFIIEWVRRNKFIENEKKAMSKSLGGQIKKYKEDINGQTKELISLIPVLKEAKNKLTNITDIMSDNIYALNYITRNEEDYNKVSFEVRYNEFINKINAIGENNHPELQELKTSIYKFNDISVYRNIVLKNIEKEAIKKNETNDNPVSDTEKK